MRFAVQSIIWGRTVTEISSLLRDAREAGYTGIELFQDFTDSQYGGPQGIANAFQQERMRLVGVASGSLAERIAFVRDYSRLIGIPASSTEAPYVYVDEWTTVCELAVKEGVRVGLHPHMFRPVQTIAEATAILNRFPFAEFPNLQLLPDTAHMTIAGDDPIETAKKHLSRISAVHIKDWLPNVGRSYPFYASGFCELGKGHVKVKETLSVLWTRLYDAWIVVEHDFAPHPQRTLQSSMEWLTTVLPPHVFR